MDDASEKEKAVARQEIAKVTSKAIDKLGPWVHSVIGEPTTELAGMWVDRLKFLRAKRGLELMERWKSMLEERGIKSPQPVPPKLAIPIIENASLEDDDELFDLWATLLTTAADPKTEKGSVRSAFVGIIQELEPEDAKILDAIYQALESVQSLPFAIVSNRLFALLSRDGRLSISKEAFRVSIENLIRLRCLSEFVEKKAIAIDDGRHSPYVENVSFSHGSASLKLTPLGRAFVQACIRLSPAKPDSISD